MARAWEVAGNFGAVLQILRSSLQKNRRLIRTDPPPGRDAGVLPDPPGRPLTPRRALS